MWELTLGGYYTLGGTCIRLPTLELGCKAGSSKILTLPGGVVKYLLSLVQSNLPTCAQHTPSQRRVLELTVLDS